MHGVRAAHWILNSAIYPLLVYIHLDWELCICHCIPSNLGSLRNYNEVISSFNILRNFPRIMHRSCTIHCNNRPWGSTSVTEMKRNSIYMHMTASLVTIMDNFHKHMSRQGCHGVCTISLISFLWSWGCLVTLTFLASTFLQQKCFWDRLSITQLKGLIRQSNSYHVRIVVSRILKPHLI